MLSPADMERVALIVETLDKAGVSSILWGTNALNIYGVPIAVTEYSFIVPTELITAGFEACRGIESVVECHEYQHECPFKTPTFRGPLPAKHLHLLQEETGKIRFANENLYLYQMSQIFHPEQMPNMEIPGNDKMFASDSRIPHKANGYGCGPYPANLYPVPILTPRCFTETLIRLGARDIDTGDEDIGSKERLYEWTSKLGRISEHVWPEFFHYTELGPQFRWWWKMCELKNPPRLKRYEGFRRLKSKLLPWSEEAALPVLPNPNPSSNQ